MPWQLGKSPTERVGLALPKLSGGGLFNFMTEKIKSLFLSVAIFVLAASFAGAAEKSANVGVYYFDGWAGKISSIPIPHIRGRKGRLRTLAKIGDRLLGPRAALGVARRLAGNYGPPNRACC